jgi:hypothetical protein
MSTYYILRPRHDTMVSEWADAEASWSWTLNFFTRSAVVAAHSFACSLPAPRTHYVWPFCTEFCGLLCLGHGFQRDENATQPS